MITTITLIHDYIKYDIMIYFIENNPEDYEILLANKNIDGVSLPIFDAKNYPIFDIISEKIVDEINKCTGRWGK